MSKNDRRTVRKAFTLPEFLVTIFIVATLAILLIPAIMAARESSRKLTCANNLKQVGLALSGYETAHKVYPQGSNNFGFSAQTMILPFMENNIIYNAINFSVDNGNKSLSVNGVNFTIAQTKIATFCCPSDPDANIDSTTSYAMNGGFGFQLMDFVGTFCGAGTRGYHYIGASAITDGLSNTTAVSEWRVGNAASANIDNMVFNIKIDFSPANFLKFIDRCSVASVNNAQFGASYKGCRWAFSDMSKTILNFNLAPNSKNCLFSDIQEFGNWPAGSYHKQGANVLFHDNHVVFVSDSVSLNLLRSFSSRNRSDTIE